MTQRELIAALLEESELDADKMIGKQSAFNILEAAIWGALDIIDAAPEN